MSVKFSGFRKILCRNLSSSPIFLIISVRDSPGFAVVVKAFGRPDTEERKSSRPVSMADRAVERANACENAYLAGRVSIGSEGEARGDGSTSSGFASGDVVPRMIRSPCKRVNLSEQVN